MYPALRETGCPVASDRVKAIEAPSMTLKFPAALALEVNFMLVAISVALGW